jgi:hypothetical protein
VIPVLERIRIPLSRRRHRALGVLLVDGPFAQRAGTRHAFFAVRGVVNAVGEGSGRQEAHERDHHGRTAGASTRGAPPTPTPTLEERMNHRPQSETDDREPSERRAPPRSNRRRKRHCPQRLIVGRCNSLEVGDAVVQHGGVS